MKSDRLWLVFLGGIPAACLLCAALIPLFAQPATSAEVYQNGNYLQTLRLDEPVGYTLFSANGGSNTIEVRDGRIRISHATCPDQVCVNQGWVSTDATPIVCLPNGLVIQVKGGDRNIDGQTG